MLSMSGYQINDMIYESLRTKVYRGFRHSDKQRVIFKTLAKKYPTTAEVARLTHEYNLMSSLDYPWSIRALSIETYGNSPVFVMEDFGGESLSASLKNKQYTSSELLNLAICITDILEKIHEQNIIHKDINPSNIIWNPEIAQLKIIDFGISTKLSRENLSIKNPNQLEGTLPYISPEQTGRMNRSLDYRSDFYSLGVTFYHMFTGKLPFEATNPLELVHCHLAKMPLPPHKLNREIPPPLSKIILKLMAKTPEERYQGTYGLRKDLERCLNTLIKDKSDDFEIGQEDISERFYIPEKLYGREKEISEIIKLFYDAANGKKEILFVFGSPGIGKSALINEIHKPIIEKHGYFCSGKHDQYRRNIPYSAIIQAVRELLKEFLSESEDKLAILKKEILEAVGSSGQVITDVISEVELITGIQPKVQELPSTEAKNRFHSVFQNFMKVFTKKDNPLVLFLDDLQWSDNASLELIRVLVEDPELKYFLFIGAYRDNEVDTGHPLSLMLEEMRKYGLSWRDIQVGPLDKNHIGRLLADTLFCEVEKTGSLANLLLQKTGGNPFFLKEYLKTLYEHELIKFLHTLKERGAIWTWDLSQIQKAKISDNVVALIVEKVKKLPQTAWNTLKIACCIGEKPSLTLLASIYGKSKADTFEDLNKVIEEGIIILIENNLKFVHDKVLEAAYSLIDEKEQKELHYTIGKSIANEHEGNVPDNLIFIIADQWNRSMKLLNEIEQRQLVRIDFRAGQKARASTAYDAAVNFFRLGGELLSEDSWKSDYKFTLSFYTEWSEAEYLARNFEKGEELSETVLHKAKDIMDKTGVYSFRITHYISQAMPKKALDMGRDVLKQLCISLPKKGSKLLLIKELIKSKLLLRKRKAKDLFNLPEMTDEKKISTLDFMFECTPATVMVAPEIMPILTLKMVNLSLKYGNSPVSSYAYALYGVILSAALGDIETGYEFGEFALELAEKIGWKRVKPGVYFLFSVIILHFKKPFKETLEYIRKSYPFCLEVGDFQYYALIYGNYVYNLFYSGENLVHVKEVWSRFIIGMKNLKEQHNLLSLNIWGQAIKNLSGESGDRIVFKEIFDEEIEVQKLLKQNNNIILAVFYTAKTMVACIFCEYAAALEYAETSEKYLSSSFGLPLIQVFHYFHALALAAHHPEVSNKKKKKYLKKLRSIQKLYKKWGEHNRGNYLHKYLLITAEIYRITGKDMEETARLYSEAIKLAHENGIVHEEAIANELAAKYYLSLGQEKIATLYMNEAHYCYKRWGCKPKVKDLEEEYPGWITGKEKQKGRGIEDTAITTGTIGSSEALDLGTIIKASSTIAREIKLDQLLKKMMEIVIENAGAQKGVLIENIDESLLIQAEGNTEGVSGVLQAQPAAESGKVPLSVINYVAHSKQKLVFDNISKDPDYSTDNYIQKNQPRSVVCFPILSKGELSAIIYLENNLVEGAFTPARLEVLNMLAAQIAISVENAGLYENLEEKVAQRTQELREKNEQILDSIRYSKRIQTAIMPLEEKLKRELPEHFILFLPRDIVSGDFYWYTEIDNRVIFAVVDCTGHGVPGALLAMMGDIFLKEIINTDQVFEPGKILEALHIKVRTHLRQEEDKAETMDGMDVCLCCFEREKGKLYFAGARRPLFIIKDYKTDPGEDMSKLTEIRGDRKSIGGRQKEAARKYTTHEIEVQKGDMIYLTSDGFAHQPDPHMKKYGSNRLKAFLTKMARFPAKEQKQYLEEELKTHQDTEKQRDDITIAGIRL